MRLEGFLIYGENIRQCAWLPWKDYRYRVRLTFILFIPTKWRKIFHFTWKTISSALSFKWTKHCNDLCSLWQHLCTPSAESDLLHTESLISFFFFSFESLISLIYYNSDDSSWYAVYTCKFWFMFGKQKCCNTILSLYSLD